ncbi:MAG: hypothetical protein JSS53_03320 [Proteobacteria bacterium]|nr:hypothetical protein [Pseudomonadota bacterium]
MLELQLYIALRNAMLQLIKSYVTDYPTLSQEESSILANLANIIREIDLQMGLAPALVAGGNNFNFTPSTVALSIRTVNPIALSDFPVISSEGSSNVSIPVAVSILGAKGYVDRISAHAKKATKTIKVEEKSAGWFGREITKTVDKTVDLDLRDRLTSTVDSLRKEINSTEEQKKANSLLELEAKKVLANANAEAIKTKANAEADAIRLKAQNDVLTTQKQLDEAVEILKESDFNLTGTALDKLVPGSAQKQRVPASVLRRQRQAVTQSTIKAAGFHGVFHVGNTSNNDIFDSQMALQFSALGISEELAGKVKILVNLRESADQNDKKTLLTDLIRTIAKIIAGAEDKNVFNAWLSTHDSVLDTHGLRTDISEISVVMDTFEPPKTRVKTCQTLATLYSNGFLPSEDKPTEVKYFKTQELIVQLGTAGPQLAKLLSSYKENSETPAKELIAEMIFNYAEVVTGIINIETFNKWLSSKQEGLETHNLSTVAESLRNFVNSANFKLANDLKRPLLALHQAYDAGCIPKASEMKEDDYKRFADQYRQISSAAVVKK